MDFSIIPKLSEGAFTSGKRFFWFTRSKLFTKSLKMRQNIHRVGFHLYFCSFNKKIGKWYAMMKTSGPKPNLKKQRGPEKAGIQEKNKLFTLKPEKTNIETCRTSNVWNDHHLAWGCNQNSFASGEIACHSWSTIGNFSCSDIACGCGPL